MLGILSWPQSPSEYFLVLNFFLTCVLIFYVADISFLLLVIVFAYLVAPKGAICKSFVNAMK